MCHMYKIIDLSSFTYICFSFKQAVANAPDVRESITGPIKAKVQNGTYDVGTDDFASKLMAAYGM